MAGRLIMQEVPELVSPYLMVGFRGWLNAGEVSTGSIDYLKRAVGARKLAHIEPKGFYIYQVPSAAPDQTLRPRTRIEDGLIKGLDAPRSEFWFWKSGGGHDLLLFSGVEPNLEWPEYAQAILDVAKNYKTPRIYTLGGVFDQVPHTRRTRTFAVFNLPSLKDELRGLTRFLNYEGPCSFTTLLLDEAGRQGIEAVGITARTPLYIQEYNARACYDLLRIVLNLTDLKIDLGDLKQAGDTLVTMTDRAFSQNQSALEQLRKMEELFDTAAMEEPLQEPGEDYDKLMEEVRNLKREGRKPH
ncbi:MAG: PAC2 family protein [Deltaproteobacteria bacterium]|nr:PAC2 family protein [Deltaproteobacteria bacterium]